MFMELNFPSFFVRTMSSLKYFYPYFIPFSFCLEPNYQLWKNSIVSLELIRKICYHFYWPHSFIFFRGGDNICPCLHTPRRRRWYSFVCFSTAEGRPFQLTTPWPRCLFHMLHQVVLSFPWNVCFETTHVFWCFRSCNDLSSS